MAKPLTAVLAAVAVLAALAAAAYAGLRLGGEGDAPRPDARAAGQPGKNAVETTSEPSGPEGLREAALSLVPPVATEPPAEEDLAEKDCTAGLEERPPPCVDFFFPTRCGPRAERERGIAETAARNGWKPWRREGLPQGFHSFPRGPYRARVGLSPDNPPGVGDRLPVLNEIQVYDLSRQPAPEPPPDSSAWSAEKREFVAAANAICARATRRMASLATGKTPRDADVVRLAELWADATDEIAALEAPPGDERPVAKIVLELRRFEKVLRMLARVEGEMALAAVVGTFEQAKRAHKAARAYGLTACLAE